MRALLAAYRELAEVAVDYVNFQSCYTFLEIKRNKF